MIFIMIEAWIQCWLGKSEKVFWVRGHANCLLNNKQELSKGMGLELIFPISGISQRACNIQQMERMLGCANGGMGKRQILNKYKTLGFCHQEALAFIHMEFVK